ncbi:hypothetical protein BDV35DRAFT_398366 [Aspergillus flavus]|uniref:BZIP domain-containing protein n=1 Tax=Aspergillus flavus TaxID=5059 RepID=A0A5N6GHV9_ASPFL|nr:hypothetical protein BDV35DRAFT_398366 [Aspergillus flavus]
MPQLSSHARRTNSARGSSRDVCSNAIGPNDYNEDWRQIKDLAERRRVQNRLAQRKYRKKLKDRLQDLEKRAASAPEFPEPSSERTEGPKNSHPVEPKSRNSRITMSNLDVPRRATAERAEAYNDCVLQDDWGLLFSHQCTHLSRSPPSRCLNSSYLGFYGRSPYEQPHSYPSLASNCRETCYAEYGASASSILPVITMTTTGHVYADEDIMSPFSKGYAFRDDTDLCSRSQPLSGSNPAVPLSSHVYSNDHYSVSTLAEPPNLG